MNTYKHSRLYGELKQRREDDTLLWGSVMAIVVAIIVISGVILIKLL